ncbi:multicopper oxidase domain-containing protein [Granulicella sp. 5B5]|uniref:multicopper oxidase family protein n=1 Tax=Granulicella sp. 5B5 TaxID=1617967 RepID=UPI0015F5FD0C|nr:multicopper oxidase domain-containing protein [Granulicella sp. 5B5]QMV18650.1 multicopper oxidase domain-containing protein [Granulicella sp. 5B5]
MKPITLPRTRRQFLMQASAAGVTALAQRSLPAQMTMPKAAKPEDMLHSLQLPPFVDELPLPERLIPPHGAHAKPLRITMREIHAKVHRDVPPTRMWSYGSTPLAPLIEARSGEATQVEWINELPTKHFLPVDYSLHGCGHDVPEVRACVHLHGGRQPSADDGYPDDWFVPGKSRVCHYPLQQEAATLWYHDHAMGLNRLNIYAGLAGMCLVRDDAEEALQLPSGKYELPLTFYDRNFTNDGQLLYLVSGDPDHPWVPEFDGDAILINGKIRPFVQVEPRVYRLRMLNAANSRFFALSFADGVTAHQIGSDQGLLAAPVPMHQLNLAPAERADVLVDFSQAAGKTVHLKNAALEVLEFRVAAANASVRSFAVPTALRPVERMPESEATTTRTITLNEYLDKIGNSMLMLLNRKYWHEPVTETPKLNATEIWEFVNLTEDTHPMHLHMVRFQVIDRRLFDVFAYRNNKGLRYLREPLQPEPNEMGWKDVVQCPPGLITRIIVKFDGYAGKYLYHCHILEHESNDMMRPFEVVA